MSEKMESEKRAAIINMPFHNAVLEKMGKNIDKIIDQQERLVGTLETVVEEVLELKERVETIEDGGEALCIKASP